jgi:FMN-dependent oxidoreductase (nitrilotriacetate monooxygenase family)
MHLCAFLIAGPVGHSHAQWRNPRAAPEFLSLDYYARIAATLERGKFDFLFFADRLAVNDRFGGDLEVGIRYGDQDATRMDPVPLLGALAATTKHLGLGATRSTSYDAPYHVAREFATLDHLSQGRAAWNVVTSMNDGEAMNFGVAEHLEHDLRYDRADEFVELALALWGSWDADALVLDREQGIYADPDRVHYVRHEGRWFRSRGPLNIPRSPQGRPVIIQAGSSGRGKRFAARWAEVIFTIQQTHDLMKRFYDDVKDELVAVGRERDSCKILTAVMPFVAPTRAAAEALRDEHNARIHPLVGLSTLASHSNRDLSGQPLDQPIATASSGGTQGLFEAVLRLTREGGLTLADVGDELEAIVRAEAADGFVISPAFLPESLDTFVDGVIPELQRRGRFRRDYTGLHLRDHLGLPAVP